MSLQNAVILKNIPAYLEVLSGFSQSVTRLWRYVRAEEALHVSAHPGSRAYRFFDASREVAFLHRMIQQAVEDEIPRELPWLSGYDKAFAQLEAEFDLPRKDLSAWIRMAQSSQGRLSARRRKQYFHLPAEVLDRVEEVVRDSFGLTQEDGSEARYGFVLFDSSAAKARCCEETSSVVMIFRVRLARCLQKSVG